VVLPPQSATRAWVWLDRWLGRGIWGVFALGVTAGLSATGFSVSESPQSLVLIVLSVFFVTLCLRLLAGAMVDRQRRPARLALLAGILLWGLGSATIHRGDSLSQTSFPGWAELFYFPSYVGIAAFLLMDTTSRTPARPKLWLDTLLICGALTCLAGAVLASPLGNAFEDEGLALLLFLVYPLLDFGLVVLVVAQVVLGTRSRGRDTTLLVLGLVTLAICDVTLLVLAAPGSAYYSNVVLDILFGLSFALLATGACARRAPASARPRTGRYRGNLLVGAGGVALLTLVLRPADSGAWFVTAPAVLTLVAAGARLTIALREAQGAAEARQLSRTDELTGLLNRRAILADLDARIRSGGPLALMLIDLDGFKEVNDSLGHSAGDQLLKDVADRLLSSIPASSRASRIGGDEFAIMVFETDDIKLMRLARQLRARLSEPIAIEGLDLAVGASVGITRWREGDADAVSLLRRADVAMYRAKHSRLGESMYDPAHDSFSRDRLEQVESLRHGIVHGQLRLWYQPQIDASTQQVTAVEALVRWQHPTHGLLSPLAFLPEARRAGLMGPLTDAVVEMVIADARGWAARGLTFTVAFNCAPPELLGGRLLPRLLAALDASGLPPDRLLVEVTEDSFVTDPERARSVLHELRRNHVQTAIDDYGTGFSSLAYLRDLPVQELKIDRSFIATLSSDPRSKVIVDSTLQMAHAMGLRLVAEGVEDARTAAQLVAMGVDVLQGYHIARPMPADEIDSWVDRWHSDLRTQASH
jgi:diguanylate cyclase